MVEFSDATGRAIISKHFPNADPKIVDRHAFWLSPPMLTSLPSYNVVKDGGETDAKIETFRRALAEAWKAYTAIPLHVRRGCGVDWVAFAKVTRMATGLPVLRGEASIQPPAIQAMKRAARKADRLSAQAMKAEHPAKIALAEKARDAWRDLSGQEAPLKPSDGSPFLQFVQDLIEAAERNWGADKVLAAWRTAETNLAR